jgi:hypothetical protein
MRVWVTCKAEAKNWGNKDKVKKPCAIGAPKGPALARSGSMWILSDGQPIAHSDILSNASSQFG